MRFMAFFFMLFQLPLLAQDISKDELLGHFDPRTHPDFILIEDEYTSKRSIYLRKEVYEAYLAMYAAAAQEGIQLTIVSATRNFNYQRGIWERKWDRPRYMGWEAMKKAEDILSYSSMPGSSRHHWGTDIDLCQLNNDWFESGHGKRTYEWLKMNASTFGFHQVYTNKRDGRTGYNEEKWHWSYLPLADVYLETYNAVIEAKDFSGFSGADLADSLRIIVDFVNGVEYVID